MLGLFKKGILAVWTFALALTLLSTKQAPALPPPPPSRPFFTCTALQFTPDGKYIVAAINSNRRQACLAALELSKKKWTKFEESELLPYNPTPIACYPDSETVISPGPGPRLRFWNLRTGKPLRSVPTTGKWLNSISLTVDGKYLLCSEEKTLVLREGLTGKELKRLRTGPTMNLCALSPQGQFALAECLGGGATNSSTILWDVVKDKPLLRYPDAHSKGAFPWGFGGRINQLVFSPRDNQVLRVVGAGLSILDLTYVSNPRADRYFSEKGFPECFMEIPIGKIKKYINVLPQSKARYCVSTPFTPTGRFFLTGSVDEEPRLWEVATGRVALVLKQEGRQAFLRGNQFAISPDGRLAASAEPDGFLVIWDLRTGTPIWLTNEWIGSGF